MPIPDSLRAELAIAGAAAVAGGCIHTCYRVSQRGATRFLKFNSEAYADAFAAEADGLAALRRAGARAPEPVLHGVSGRHAYLLLEFLDLDGAKDYAALARMLANLHRSTGARFGWHRDNYIGSTPQQNGEEDDWSEFFVRRRLGPQIALAQRNGFAIASLSRLEVLEGYAPAASLLHGDLWYGNAGFTAAGPVMFDPAVHYGDREADLAMTELFGGFPREFYAAYTAEWPLEQGYERRKHLYNLYHLLNHLNLFGAGYLARVEATLGLLRLLP